MDLSIIIVSYNTKKLLEDCLKSIYDGYKDTGGYKMETFVVDNGSNYNVKSQISNLKKKYKKLNIILIENKENLGFAKANNQAIRQAAGRYLLLLNSDTVVFNKSLLKMVKFMDQHPKAGVVGGKLLNKDGSSQPSTAPFYTLPVTAVMLFGGDRFLRVSPDKTCEVDWVMGACMMVRCKAIKEAGLLDENFFMYIEEVEWCYRIKKAGFKIYFYPKAPVSHLMRGSSTTGKKMAIFNIYKGLVYFYQKHMPFWQLAVLRLLLKTKALVAVILGYLTNNSYLKETYAKAFRLA